MSREYIKRVMVSLFEKLHHKNPESLKQDLNSKDDKGCALIHYICALNYHDLIPLMHEYGADINLPMGDKGRTPLVIAAARGNEKTVKKLMRLGASLNSQTV